MCTECKKSNKNNAKKQRKGKNEQNKLIFFLFWSGKNSEDTKNESVAKANPLHTDTYQIRNGWFIAREQNG